jgi:conjugal transfer/entry exclusion protein
VTKVTWVDKSRNIVDKTQNIVDKTRNIVDKTQNIVDKTQNHQICYNTIKILHKKEPKHEGSSAAIEPSPVANH